MSHICFFSKIFFFHIRQYYRILSWLFNELRVAGWLYTYSYFKLVHMFGVIARIFKLENFQGPKSIKWYHLTNTGNPIMEIRRSYGRLISTMGFPILVRWRLYIESRPMPNELQVHIQFDDFNRCRKCSSAPACDSEQHGYRIQRKLCCGWWQKFIFLNRRRASLVEGAFGRTSLGIASGNHQQYWYMYAYTLCSYYIDAEVVFSMF